mmetsp:Transcript_26861/g.58957  ORF Transcript_26861/g.58957 Transcript_26861/m.58957 type:complete len:92 (-) Transcript_26861:549-824(-)
MPSSPPLWRLQERISPSSLPILPSNLPCTPVNIIRSILRPNIMEAARTPLTPLVKNTSTSNRSWLLPWNFLFNSALFCVELGFDSRQQLAR